LYHTEKLVTCSDFFLLDYLITSVPELAPYWRAVTV
jgi:hypothetical protein